MNAANTPVLRYALTYQLQPESALRLQFQLSTMAWGSPLLDRHFSGFSSFRTDFLNLFFSSVGPNLKCILTSDRSPSFTITLDQLHYCLAFWIFTT